MKANDLSNFSFTFAGAGHYKVTYTTGRGDYLRRAVYHPTFTQVINQSTYD